MPLPAVDVVVAALDEAAIIADKIRNLADLDYPAGRLRIFLVDGDSSDHTLAQAAAAAAQAGLAVTMLQAGRPGKARQLNLAIPAGDAPWILVTDADARLHPAALREMVGAAGRTGADVVGAPVAVHSTFVPEQIHWWLSNLLRSAEARVLGSAGLVVGPCYLIRRGLVESFPDDAQADDVFVACRSAALQARLIVAGPLVSELRVAGGPIEFVRHKYRKARGYLHEVARALPAVSGRAGSAASAFRVRLLLMAALPLAALTAAAAAVAVWTVSPAAAALAAGILIAPGLGLRLPRIIRPLGAVSWVLLTGLILIAAFAGWGLQGLCEVTWRPRLNYPPGHADTAS